MVVIMKREFTPEQLEAAVHTMEEGGVKVMVSKGAETTILGAEGNAEHIDQEKLSLLPGVERVMRVTEPYKKANRKYHPEDTVIELSNGRSVGGNRLAVIAGPCSVESEAQIVGVAQAVKASGAAALQKLADKLGDALDSIVSDLDTLETALTSCHEDILAAMSRLRTSVDAAETLVNDRSWPLPKYREMLFIY